MVAFLRKYGTGTGADVDVPIIKRAVVDFAVGADWTPAAGDVKISKDGGAAANIGTLPTAVAMGNSAYWKFVFADAELQCKRLIVTVADSATKAVEDQAFVVETYGNASAMYQADLSAANLPANVKQWNGETPPATAITGVPKVDLHAWDGSTDTADVVLGNAAIFNGIADSGSTTSLVCVGLTQSATDHWKWARIRFTSGTNSGLEREVSGFTPGTDTLTWVEPLPAAVAAAHTFLIKPNARAQANATALAGGDQSATDLKDFADTGYDPAAHKVAGVVLVDTLITYTGNTPQTGDAFNRLGANGAGLTGVPWNSAWDAEVQSECADALTAFGASTLTAAAAADAVWDEAIGGHLGAGSTGAALNAAGSAGDPWTTPLPGAYGAGTAGKIIGDNLNTTVGSRMATFTLPANFSALGINGSGHVSRVTLLDTLSAYTGNTPQTGDAFNRIGVNGAGLTALGDARIANLDTTASSRASQVTANDIKAKTDTIPINPSAVGSAMTLANGALTTAAIADGAITDAKFTVPAIAGVATGVLSMIVQLWRRMFKKTHYDIAGGTLKTFADNGTSVLTTQQVTATATDEDVGAAT